MKQVLIFGGTVEGRELAQWCAQAGLPVVVSVATEYGEALLEEAEWAAGARLPEILQGRMDAPQIQMYLRDHPTELVIDATHPYAAEATRNIRRACEAEGAEYVRLLRENRESAVPEAETGSADRLWLSGRVLVSSCEEAAQYLTQTDGNILLTTGSKELSAFTERLECSRLYVRVLPSADSIRSCEENGIPSANRIAMQGPFSEEMNRALLRQFDCRYLVTKESGAAGGYPEKCAACAALGVTAVVIRRPSVEKGLDFSEVCGYLRGKYQILSEAVHHGTVVAGQQQIIIAGIGMGSEASLTLEVRDAIDRADMLVGGSRMLQPYLHSGKQLFASWRAEEIRAQIDAHPECRTIVVLMSGDVGFYSGTRNLLDILQERNVTVLSGISSVAYLAAKAGLPWQNMELCSLHGRRQNVLARIRRCKTVFALTGSGSEVPQLCTQLLEWGLGDVELYVGEQLSYPDERIWHGFPAEGAGQEFGSLCSLIAVNPRVERLPVRGSIPDEAWVRGKVPMTKEAIRILSIAKLQLYADSVVYDVGAGTGSVSIEAALAAEDGMVYAIEKKDEAVALIRENKRRFGVVNLQVVHGTAPQALEDLPVPTHAFIGGSSGNLQAIVECLMEKNPAVRIVINAISLETMAEIARLSGTCETEVMMVQTARANPVGAYHLMMGQNPVMIAVVQRKECPDTGGTLWQSRDL